MRRTEFISRRLCRVALVGLFSGGMDGCATHYIGHAASQGRAYVTRGNDLLYCRVVERTPRCWTAVNISNQER